MAQRLRRGDLDAQVSLINGYLGRPDEPWTHGEDGKAKANIGHLRIPAGLPSGTYTIQVTAEDFAHNSTVAEVMVEVIGGG